jgi:hypothetical protein
MKVSVLRDQGISFAPWGIAAVKAVVLPKFILIGRAMKIGEPYFERVKPDRPVGPLAGWRRWKESTPPPCSELR